MAEQTGTVYIQLEKKRKNRVILGAGLLWFYNCMFSFTIAAALPAMMEAYDMMWMYAILGGMVSLLSCVATPIGGKLGDRYGRRKVVLTAGYLRLALIAVCGFQTRGPVFCVAYCIACMLGGLMGSYPSTILGDVTTTQERPRWLGLFGGINGAAFMFGLLLGGIVADQLGTFAAFLVFAPIQLVALILLTLTYPNKPSERPAPIDKVGMVLMVGFVGCILAWCAFGEIFFPRFSPVGIGLLIAGVVFFGLLIYAESRIKEPLINLKMFKNKAFCMSFSTHLLVAPMMCLCSGVLVLFGQKALGLSATVCGTLAIPKNILFALVPPILGIWVSKDHYRFRYTFLTYALMSTIGGLIASTWDQHTTVTTIYLTMIVFGISTCCQAASIQPYAQISLPPQELGIGMAMIMFGNTFGVAVFNAFYNIVYNARYAQAVSMGEQYIPGAISEVFSSMALLSAACNVIVFVLVFFLTPSRKQLAEKLAKQQ
jgi:MFS family permease